MNTRVIHADCRHFRTDRPCAPHKRHGYVCDGCPAYEPTRTRVLIIKLDATGDVLRTTSLLRPLHAVFPHAHVTWVTRREAVDVLRPNALIDEVVALDAEALLLLQAQPFDVVINPDASITSSRLAAVTRAPDKRGFTLDGSGNLLPLNADAEYWFACGLDDGLKKANDRTYQSILLGMSGLPSTEHPVVWETTNSEVAFAAEFASRHELVSGPGVIVGLNTGAGGRWRWKKWTELGYVELVTALLKEQPEARVLLYGGPEERERNAELARLVPGRLVDTGTGNTLREFGALVGLCDIMVTGDTMALHLASALGKRIVALFGPTSAPEIELYGRGTKIAPRDMPCLGCYLSDCEVSPSCMERISAEQVMAAVRIEVDAVLDSRVRR